MPTTRNNSRSPNSLSSVGIKRPVWVPATTFYLLSFLLSFVLFLSVWGVLQEGDEDFAVWIGASAAIVAFASSVMVREVFLRRRHRQYLVMQRQLDEVVARTKIASNSPNPQFKITQRQNAEMLRRIKRKSDAAKELGDIARGHLEVFDLCAEYLALNREQIDGANPGSPRLQDLRQGREVVRRLHHFHLLAWAQIESTALTAAARACDTLEGRFHSARQALKVLETALQHYPKDSALMDSELAVREFIASVQLANWLEVADQQSAAGDFKGAAETVSRALSFIEADGEGLREKNLVVEKLRSELSRLSNQAQGAKERTGSAATIGNDQSEMS